MERDQSTTSSEPSVEDQGSSCSKVPSVGSGSLITDADNASRIRDSGAALGRSPSPLPDGMASRLGCIGLGNMGLGMALNLAKHNRILGASRECSMLPV